MKITPIRINPHPGFLKIRIIRIQTNPAQVGWISNSGSNKMLCHLSLFKIYLVFCPGIKKG